MIALPSIILERFDQLLRNKALPGNARFNYTKWLRFYWDFCHKYQHDPFSVDSLWLFLQKQQEKRQSDQQQKQARHAVSLFYSMQSEFDPVSFDSDIAAAKDLSADTSIQLTSRPAVSSETVKRDDALNLTPIIQEATTQVFTLYPLLLI